MEIASIIEAVGILLVCVASVYVLIKLADLIDVIKEYIKRR